VAFAFVSGHGETSVQHEVVLSHNKYGHLHIWLHDLGPAGG